MQETPLQSIRRSLALAVGENAVFDGWTRDAVISAARQVDIDEDKALLAFPKTPAAMVDAYIDGMDQAMEAHFTPDMVAAMKVRDRIRGMIWFRLETAAPAREAVRSGLAIQSMPQNVPGALKTAWRTADRMWRLAGDTATDYNHYTKRLTLSGVYGATLLAWLDDDSDNMADTAAFLDRRLENVMQFEKLKSKLAGPSDYRFSMSRFLGRLRYPPRG